jgi:hypothetical protein
MSDAIVTTKGNGNSLVQFGDRDQVREMAERITKMMPGTTKLNATEALTVAQIAVAHGLDPFNGEVWGLKGENDKWYGTMVGIKGLRKAAKRQADAENGTYWTEPPKRVDPKTYNLPDTAVVYETWLRDTVTMQAYGKSLYTLTQAGIPYAEAIRMIGNAPVCVGVGVATPEERSKMGLHARAKKRSEADAIKQRYDVTFVGVQYTEAAEDLPADAVVPEVQDGEYTQTVPEPTETEKRTADQILMELGVSN